MQRLMCRLLVAAIVVVVASAAYAQSDKVALTGFLMDKMCAAKAIKSGNADAAAKKHTKECAEACNESGFGLVTANKFYLFDAKGNELAQTMLKTTKKTDSLGIEVVGTVDGDKIKVDSLKEVE